MLVTTDKIQLPTDSGYKLWKEERILTLLAHAPSGSRSPGKWQWLWLWLWLCPGGAEESWLAGSVLQCVAGLGLSPR